MDLTTRYMGLTLKNPLVASASPLSERVDVIRQLEDSGASAVVLFSLFEEQIRHDTAALELFRDSRHTRASARRFVLPGDRSLRVGPGQYLELIRKATDAVDIPVIASLNGVDGAGWVDFAKNAGGRGQRNRIERVLHPHGVESYRDRSGTAVRRRPVGASREWSASRWR